MLRLPLFSRFVIVSLIVARFCFPAYAQGRLPYLYQQMDKPQYHAALVSILAGQRLAPWLKRYLSVQDGVDVPGHPIVVGGQVAEAYSVCQPHNCGVSEIHVIFTPGGERAWALFIDGETRQFFGNPDGVMKASLSTSND